MIQRPCLSTSRIGSVVLTVIAATSAAGAGIIPADRMTVWNPGIPGGVPARTTICANVNASTYGNGSADASAGIQSALNACPAGQVVLLSGGYFRIDSDPLEISKGITLRGAGMGLTVLKRTNGAHLGSETASVYDPVVIIGPYRWPAPDNTTSRALSVDGAKGSMSVTVTNGSGFATGQFVLLDEDDYNTGSWQSLPNRDGQPTSVKIWATDRAVWQRHNPPAEEDDPFPEATAWFSRAGRPIGEVKEVASVSGNIVTFTTPLHISYRAAYAAQLTRYTGQNVHVKSAGLENLTVQGGADGNVRFECAAYSWMRNVEDTLWLGEGVAINNSFRIEVRDSYVHEAAWPEPGGAGYAISFAHASAEVLIENNIVLQANKVMVSRSAGAASVVGYNYMDDGHILTAPTWVEVGINGSHMVGPHHMLFEGNESFNYDSDNTHGNAIYQTVFRNHLSGYRKSYAGTDNTRAAGLMYGSWWHTFAGNVMGTQGKTAGWGYDDPGTPWEDPPYVWRLGYDPIHWEQAPDPKVRSTVLREGNYDYVTNLVHWDTAPQTIPDSLYLTGKPAFFGSLPWPWVDPTGATKLYTLPAKLRSASPLSNGDLSITKTDGQASVTAGTNMTYTIVAANVGPSVAIGAKVTDTFPAALGSVTWTCAATPSSSCGTASGSGNLNQSVTLAAGGNVTFLVHAAVAMLATGTLANTATVTVPVGFTDPVPGNNTATDTDTVVAANADLSITKSDGSASVSAGSLTTYTIVVSSAGPSNLTGVTVTDTFPAGLTSVSWTCTPSTGSSCGTTSGAGNLNQSVNLAAGGLVMYSAEAVVSAGAPGTLANTATVAVPAGVTDPTPGNNSATDTDTVTAAALTNDTGGSARNLLLGSTATDTLGAAPDDENWFRFRVRAGHSYCVEVDNGRSEVSIRDTVLTVYHSDGTTAVGTNDNTTAEPAASRLSRVCYIAALSEPNLVRVTAGAVNVAGSFRLRAVETTLYGPWLVSGGGYEAFVLLRNTTGQSHTTTVTLWSPSGATMGNPQTGAVPGNGSRNLLVSAAPPTGFGVSSALGSAMIAHDGPPGAVTGTVTSMSFTSGVSFDTPAAPRQDNR